MAGSAHTLSTCRIPLSALTLYYRRGLAPPSKRRQPGLPAVGRHQVIRILVDEGDEPVTVSVAEFAAHTAYLEPVTGAGLLVAPLAGTDVIVPDDWGLKVAWPDADRDRGNPGGLSLQTADRAHALRLLERDGWRLLANEDGLVEAGGRTVTGRPVVCLHATQTVTRQLVLSDFQRAVTALHVAADLRHD